MAVHCIIRDEGPCPFRSFSYGSDTSSRLVVILFFTLIVRRTRLPTYLNHIVGISIIIRSVDLLTYHDDFEPLHRLIETDFLLLEYIIFTFTCHFWIGSCTSTLIHFLNMLHFFCFWRLGLYVPFSYYCKLYMVGQSNPYPAFPSRAWKST